MLTFAAWRSRLLRVTTDVTIGALLALGGFFVYQSKLEAYHFTRLVHRALGLPPDQPNAAPLTEANVLLITRKVNFVLNGRSGQVADVGHPEPGLLWSSDEHLTEPSGACASYTQVLGKALETAGYPVRKVGLSKGSQRGIHHVLETHAEGHWVLVDGQSNLAFRRPDGHLASAAEVHADWAYYRQQTPPGYNADYDYSSYYYTNWRKLPVVGAIVEGVPPLHRWLEARGVSLWFLLLDVNQWFARLSFASAALLVGVRLWPEFRRWRARRSSSGAGTTHQGGGDKEHAAQALTDAPAV